MIRNTLYRTLRRALGALLASTLLLGCIPEETAEAVELTPFFNLQAFVDAEVERLEANVPRADKSITFNEEVESHEAMELDYEDELAVFRNADINRPAWLEKYSIDSTRGGSRLQVEYVALDTTLAVRSMRVIQEGEQVVRIEVESQTGTVLSDGRRFLRYEPATGYLIDSYQDRRFGGNLDTRIEVRFPE